MSSSIECRVVSLRNASSASSNRSPTCSRLTWRFVASATRKRPRTWMYSPTLTIAPSIRRHRGRKQPGCVPDPSEPVQPAVDDHQVARQRRSLRQRGSHCVPSKLGEQFGRQVVPPSGSGSPEGVRCNIVQFLNVAPIVKGRKSVSRRRSAPATCTRSSSSSTLLLRS